MSKKPPNGCNCIKLTNEALKPDNVRLATRSGMLFDHANKSLTFAEDIPIPVERINNKKRTPLPVIVCTYCPICGKRLNREQKPKANKARSR